jgi:hypothetical protein
MATNKKSARFIGIDPNVAFRLQLDPDIYHSGLAPILGVGNGLFEGVKVVDASIAVATRNGHASLLKVVVLKGEESRQINLICDAEKTDTAKAELVGKTVKLGFGANAVDWTIDRVL